MSPERVQVQLPREGRPVAAAGVTILLKSAAEDTDGRWTLYEYTAPPRFAGPPPHWHRETEEAFFVLEGSVRFELDGESIDAPAGAYVRVPPGVVHGFSNPTDEPARFLGLIVPGGFERYWDELAELMADAPAWPPEDPTPVLELMARYDAFPPPAS
jgi:mannose-6-phosphate isomerase-like protein (cupin superfamily)